MTEEKLELQFERAELDGPSPSSPPSPASAGAPPALQRIPCVDCGTHVRSYFSVNARSVCQRCHDAAVADHRGLNPAAFLKALGLGLVAAVVGAAIYFGVAKLTGYEIGLVSIAVGLLVGGAVRLGSGRRGGWRYQALAVGLCYLSIASSYGAFVVAELLKRDEAPVAAAAPPDQAAMQPAGLAAEGDPAAKDAVAPGEVGDAPSGAQVVGGLLLLVLQLPFLIGLESPMTFLLVAIALWEAWKLNVGQPFEASGPFAVGSGAPAAG